MYKEDEDKIDVNDLHSKALNQFNKIQSAMHDERKQCLEDRRFYSIAGAMWEGPLQEQFENKPKLEINKVHLAVIRIINEYRNNRITVNFLPKDGTSNTLTDVCSDLYRADEYASNADEAYDNGFEEGVGGGFGAWRLRPEYADPDDIDDEKQVIRIEPIFDADSSVYFDLDAKRQDKADAKHAFVLYSKTHDEFNEEYDEDVSSWPKTVQDNFFDWLTPDIVYIAEYYVKEEAKVTYTYYKGLNGDLKKYKEEELDSETKNELKATGYKRERKRTVAETRVHKYIMCGNCILSDEGYIAGPNIPIVPYYGKRWFIDNVERCMGHVRLAKDPQRLKNMQVSRLAELSAFSTIEKPIVTPEQIVGHELRWANDNIVNYPFLTINALTDGAGNKMMTGPVGYTKVPNIPPAMAALIQLVDADMKEVLGNQEAGEQLDTPMSGVAIELVQNKLDMQTFIYVDNFKKAMRRSGEIWLGIAKEIYVEEGRKLRTVNSAGEHSSISVGQPGLDHHDLPTKTNDLTKANFDVDAKAGPTSASKRAAIVRALGGLLQLAKDPQSVNIITAMIMMNLEGEGIDDVRQYYRKQLLQLGVLQPTQEEAEELQKAKSEQKPDANTVYLEAAADEAQSTALMNRMKTVLTAAQTEKTKAEAIKTLKEAEGGKFDQVFRAIEVLSEHALNGAKIQDMQQQAVNQGQDNPASAPVDLPKQQMSGQTPAAA